MTNNQPEGGSESRMIFTIDTNQIDESPSIEISKREDDIDRLGFESSEKKKKNVEFFLHLRNVV